MKPIYQVPEDRLIDFASLKSKAKPLSDFLKIPPKMTSNRKDLAANWDSVF